MDRDERPDAEGSQAEPGEPGAAGRSSGDVTGRPEGAKGDCDGVEGGTSVDEEREGAYELLQRGRALMRGRHNAQAAIVLERAARLEGGKGSILEALGRAYYNSGQPQRAAETFSELLEIDPTAHYGHFALGQSLKRLGRRREARTHLKLAVALDPGSALYRNALDRLGPIPEEA